MIIDELLCGPKGDKLDHIAKGKSPILITGFYGPDMLRRVAKLVDDNARLLVRMPPPGLLPKILPNDPAALIDFATSRPKAKIFTHPAIHAKLYVSSNGGLIGSANLSNRGFSGQFEAALYSSNQAAIAEMRAQAEKFIANSQARTLADLRKLAQAVKDGKAAVASPPEDFHALALANAGQNGNPPFETFTAWLAGQTSAEAKEALKRCLGHDNLQGHAFTAYNGLCVMFRGDPAWAKSLRGQAWDGSRVATATRRIATFIKNNPGVIKGKKTAVWEKSYLPKSLGGQVVGGGAAIGLIKRLMILIPDFLVSHSII